jgi:hypothetical protein
MRRYASSPLSLGLIFMVSMLIVAAIALGLSKGGNPQASQDQSSTVPVVVNQTEALRVESLTSVDAPPDAKEKSYILTLKNVSSRKLVAWVVKPPSGATIAAGAVISNAGLEPGQSFSHTIYDTSPNKPGPKQITIALAMFEDGSSEGDFSTHEFVTNSRAASKLQMERINEILQAALLARHNTKGQSLKTNKQWLQDIASEISQLPQTAPPNQPSAAMGLISSKEGSLALLKDLIEWEDVRHTDSLKANGILRNQGSLFGASDVQDGVLKIIRHNENLIEKNTFRGRLNEK